MADLILNAHTQKTVDEYLAHPSHAICLVGPPGAGKHFTALQLASKVLGITDEDAIYSVGELEDVGIEAVRKLQRFLQLKKPGTNEFRRAVLVENAERMSGEAQNALLKTLEEPPADAIFILTANSLSELRPTIRSRCQVVSIKPLTVKEAEKAFSSDKLAKTYALSGGYAGLLYGLIEDPEHELVTAVTTAKQLLQAPMFDRLAMIDGLVKSKADLKLLFYALQRVLGAVLANAQPDRLNKLTQASRALYEAQADYKRSANSKLLLTDLFLQL